MIPNNLGRPFLLFLLGRLLVWAGGAIAMVAFPLAVWNATADPAWTAALTALETAPYLVFGLPAGAVADRFSRRLVMGATGIAAAATIAGVVVIGPNNPWALLAAATLSSSFFVFSDAAGFGLLPELVPKARIADAVGQSTAASTLVTMAGPALAGGLVGLVGVPWSLGIDAALAGVGSLALLLLPRPSRAASGKAPLGDDAARELSGDPAAPSAPTIVAQIAEGLRFLFSHALVRTLTLLGIGNSLAGGMMLGLLVPEIARRFAAGADSGPIGVAYSALGIGTFLATLALPRLSRKISPGVVTIGGLFAVGAGIATWAVVPGLPAGLVTLALYQLAASTVILNGITIRHLATPERLQARVNTTARMIAWGGQPLGAALAGALSGVLSAQSILLGAAVVVAATAALALRSPLVAEGRRFHAALAEERAQAAATDSQ